MWAALPVVAAQKGRDHEAWHGQGRLLRIGVEGGLGNSLERRTRNDWA